MSNVPEISPALIKWTRALASIDARGAFRQWLPLGPASGNGYASARPGSAVLCLRGNGEGVDSEV